VEAALPPGAEHKIIECHSDWARARAIAALDHEIVAFVDDDDYISESSLSTCLAALGHGLGSACTVEVRVDEDGIILGRTTGIKTYEGAAIHPMAIHHLFMFRGNLVDPRILDLISTLDVGVDWMIRASVALQHGCWSIPTDGYYWTSHPGQHTIDFQARYCQLMPETKATIRRLWFGAFRGSLPTFSENQTNLS
jgi:hypothetical protein